MIRGNENVFDVSIGKNCITRIAFKNNEKWLYLNGAYNDDIRDIRINIDAMISHTGPWSFAFYNLLIRTKTKQAKNDEETSISDEEKTRYYDVRTVKFDTSFLNENNLLIILHDAVNYEHIKELIKQKNIKLFIIECHESDNWRTRHVFHELSLYLFKTGKYDIIFMTVASALTNQDDTPQIVIGEHGKKLAYLSHNNANTIDIYRGYKKRILFYDEIYSIVSRPPPFKMLTSTILFVPNKSQNNLSFIQHIHEYWPRFDVFTNDTNYKTHFETRYSHFIVVDDTDEQRKFAECMLKNAPRNRKRVIILTDGKHDSNDRITIYRDKNTTSFLL